MPDEKNMRDTDKPVSDKREGIVRDPVNWQGQVVSYVKDIGNGDPGYNANIRQVLITLADGSEKVVPESEIRQERAREVESATELSRANAPPRELTEQEVKERQARQDQHDAALHQDRQSQRDAPLRTVGQTSATQRDPALKR